MGGGKEDGRGSRRGTGLRWVGLGGRDLLWEEGGGGSRWLVGGEVGRTCVRVVREVRKRKGGRTHSVFPARAYSSPSLSKPATSSTCPSHLGSSIPLSSSFPATIP